MKQSKRFYELLEKMKLMRTMLDHDSLIALVHYEESLEKDKKITNKNNFTTYGFHVKS